MVRALHILELSNVIFCSLKHVDRDANGCVHNLIKYVYEPNDCSVWAGVMPSSCCNPDVTH